MIDQSIMNKPFKFYEITFSPLKLGYPGSLPVKEVEKEVRLFIQRHFKNIPLEIREIEGKEL
jgi:hypothetical protein